MLTAKNEFEPQKINSLSNYDIKRDSSISFRTFKKNKMLQEIMLIFIISPANMLQN